MSNFSNNKIALIKKIIPGGNDAVSGSDKGMANPTKEKAEINQPTYTSIVRDLKKENKKAYLFFIKTFKKLFDHYVMNDNENPEKLALQKSIKMLKDSHNINISGDIQSNFVISEAPNAEKTADIISDIINLYLIKKSNREDILSQIRVGLISNANISNEAFYCVGYVEEVLKNHDKEFCYNVINNILGKLC